MDIGYVKNSFSIYNDITALLRFNAKFEYDNSRKVEEELPVITEAFSSLRKRLKGNIDVYFTEHQTTNFVFEIDIMEVKRLFSLYLSRHVVLQCEKYMIGKYIAFSLNDLNKNVLAFKIKEFDVEAYEQIMFNSIVPKMNIKPLRIDKVKSRDVDLSVIYNHLYTNENYNKTKYMTHDVFSVISSLNSLYILIDDLYASDEVKDEVIKFRSKLIIEILTNTLSNTTIEKSKLILTSLFNR